MVNLEPFANSAVFSTEGQASVPARRGQPYGRCEETRPPTTNPLIEESANWISDGPLQRLVTLNAKCMVPFGKTASNFTLSVPLDFAV
jgi:hypothetical protein